MATWQALTIQLGVLTQIGAADTLAVGAGVTTLAGNLTISSAGGTTTLSDAVVKITNTLTTPAVDNAGAGLSLGANTTSTTIGKLGTTTTIAGNLTVTGTFSGTVALAGDVTGTTAASVVSAISGASPIVITPAVLQWKNTTAGATLTQATQTSDVATNNLTIQSQAPFAGASGTNRNPGNIVFNVPSPAAGGAEASIQFQRGAVLMAAFQQTSSTATFYLGNGEPLNTTAYTLQSDATNLIVNSPGAAGALTLANGAATAIQILTASVTVTPPLISWVKGAASPSLAQAAQTTDVATNNLTIAPQPAFATATLTNRKSGSVIVNVAAPTNGGTVEAGLTVSRAGTPFAAIQAYPGFATIGTLYLGSTAAGTPGALNYTLYDDNTSTVIGAVTNFIITFAGTTYDTITTAKAAWGQPFGGVSNGPFAWSSNADLSVAAGGTFTLSAAQLANPRTKLTGTPASNVTIALPNVTGFYLFDVTALVLGANTLSFTSGTATITYTAVQLPHGGLIVADANGTNTLAACP